MQAMRMMYKDETHNRYHAWIAVVFFLALFSILDHVSQSEHWCHLVLVHARRVIIQ